MPDELKADDFAGRLGETFVAHAGDGATLAIELVEVERLAAAQEGMREGFSLGFLGPAGDVYLPQATWPLEHPALGRHDVFLVPLGPVEGRMQYQAVFT